MMPFSVLRIFALALFSWLLLGAGIYLSYQSYLRFNEQPLVVQVGEAACAVVIRRRGRRRRLGR